MPEAVRNAEKEFLRLIENTDLLDNIFGYAYKRSFNKYEAEDLCSEIITRLISSLKHHAFIGNLQAFIWKVAHNAYCDFVANQKHFNDLMNELPDDIRDNEDFTDDVLDDQTGVEQLKKVKRAIAFLSQTYREVMILFYLDEMPIKDIADKLGIPQNRVKQRLFSAKEKIREGVKSMNINSDEKLLKPLDLWMPGTGDLRNGDPRDQVRTLLARNIVISCRKKAKTAVELANEFNIPTIFMEDELKILAHGSMLKDTGDGKYIADFIIIDMDLQEKINTMQADAAKDLGTDVIKYLKSNKDKIMDLNFLEQPKSFEFTLWSMVPRFADMICDGISAIISDHLTERGIKKDGRRFFVLGQAVPYNRNTDMHFYSQNSTEVSDKMGYREITIRNYIGDRLPWDQNRFGAGVSLDMNRELGMIIKVINGISIDQLNDDEKEVAAKSIAKGYINKMRDKLVPAVIVMDKAAYETWNRIFFDAQKIIEKHVSVLVQKYIKMVEKYVPKHLLSQAQIFVELTSNPLRHYLLEECIEKGLLYVPAREKCAEGIWAVVEK